MTKDLSKREKTKSAISHTDVEQRTFARKTFKHVLFEKSKDVDISCGAHLLTVAHCTLKNCFVHT